MDAIRLLKKDHATVKSLFSKFERAGNGPPEKRAELFDQIRRELQLHSRAEQEIFYTAVKAANGEGRRLVSEALREHQEIDELLTQISRLEASGKDFTGKMETLIENVEHHIDEEEGEIFQFAQENCTAEELDQTGSELERRRKTLEQQLAA